jgi:UDPglucose 6-dehydrogenase
VVGGDAATLAVMRELYEPVVAQSFAPPPGIPRPSSMISVPLLTTSLTSAEMIKYAANAFLAMKIGFANEIANICERVGAEAPEVMTGIGLDSRIGAKFLNPGVGWGGSCFGKDIQSLLHTARIRIFQPWRPRSRSTRRNARWSSRKLQEKLYISRAAPSASWPAFSLTPTTCADALSLHIAERLIQMGVRVRPTTRSPTARRQRPT